MGLRKKIKKFLYQRKFHKSNIQLKINNKNILVTGGNSGIGLALTKNLLALNNKVLSTYREDGQNLMEINDLNLSIVKLDQSNINNFNDFEKKIEETTIDIIFNCAGVFGGSFEEQQVENIDFKKFQKILMVNSISILNIIKIILNKKKNKSKPELIINISSDAGSINQNKDGNAYIYRTSKSALNSITKNLSIDLNHKFGTTVFAIDPGNVKSGMNPGGYIETDKCAKLIIDLITTNSELNGKFVNLLGKEILW
jgi:NAD(P)-dependent dehydrogenase (short-subunit alcohol dehydrogenase family)